MSTISGVTYVNSIIHWEAYGSDGTYNLMDQPAGKSDSQYVGNMAVGGQFPANSSYIGNDGNDGSVSYQIEGGPWITISSAGDTLINI